MLQTDESPVMKCDDGNFVQFYYTTAKNEFASAREGRPIFDKVMMARVLSPGGSAGQASSIPEFEVERTLPDGSKKQRGCVVNRVQMTMRQRWERQIEAWEKNTITGEMSGTPLDQWPMIDIHQVAELNASGIRSVEMLRDIPDSKLAMGWRLLRDQAKNYLEQAAGLAPITRLTAENDRLRADMEAMKETVATLNAAVSAKRGPGRPPKVEAEAA